MKLFKIGRRSIVFALAAALVAAAFSAVALADKGDPAHPAGKGDPAHPHFLPKRFVGAPEISVVALAPQTNTFVQIVFDRGRLTAVDATAGTLTIQQGTNSTIWRTQTFTVPTTAEIVLDGHHNKSLARLKVGEHVRIQQSGPIGGTLQVVRVDATRRGRDINFPPGD
jgi:hypothetical protein